jgi:hypothetical protein
VTVLDQSFAPFTFCCVELVEPLDSDPFATLGVPMFGELTSGSFLPPYSSSQNRRHLRN